MRTESITLLTGDSAGDLTGLAKNLDQVINLSVQVTCSVNTVVGIIKLQASNDAPNVMPRTGFTPTNWVDIPNASATIAAGESELISLSNCAYGYLRVIWTHDAGGSTGTVSAQMVAVGA